MEFEILDETIELLEKANAGLEPELLARTDARKLLSLYDRVVRLGAFGVAALTRKLDDPGEVARATGTSVGKAKAVIETGRALASSDELSSALQSGDVSFEQATEIARAEQSAPGAAKELLDVARTESFQVLREASRKVALEAEQHRGLGERQRAARRASSHTGPLGMVDIHLSFEPHLGTPIVNRAEADARRRFKAAKKNGTPEPFERHLADAYAAMLKGSSIKPHSSRPELVVLVSHEVVKRGWKDVRKGETCKIPGVGPVAPQVAKEIARDAFLSGVFFDGTDLRHFKRWSRSVPVEVRVALALGEPPHFDGVKCTDCGARFRPERDHVEPHVAKGPSSTTNLKWRCRSCHEAKTARDRRAGKLTPAEP